MCAVQSTRPSHLLTSCKVRPPTERDYADIAGLAGQLGYPSSPEKISSRLAHMNRDDFIVRVAEIPGERIIGWIGAHIFRAVELDPCAEISGLVIDQNYRSQGAGILLLSAVEQWALSMGCTEITVKSNVIRERAHEFYLRNSYELLKQQKLFVKRLAN